MDFKFYHGTSTIFLESIRKTGLGGVNPNIEYKNLEVLKFLFFESEKYLLDDSDYKKIRTTTQAMVEQSAIDLVKENGEKQRCYFRHDCIYVALSLIRAIVYASGNKYGSEILLRCDTLYKLLQSKVNNILIPDEINLFGIDRLSKYKPEPIIIEVSNVDDYDLAKEDGKTAKEALDYLRNTMPYTTERDKFEFMQYCNFELLKPVPVKNLKFYRLLTSGIPGDVSFKFKLVDCQ